VRFDAEANIVPTLAESWERIDPLRLRFHLRKDVRFHNGEAFDAQSVQFTLQKILDPNTKSPVAGFLYTIDKVKEGINLRAYGQKDPLIEYKKEAFRAFEHLNNAIKSETVEKMMRVQLVGEGMEDALERMKPTEPDTEDMNYSAPSENVESFTDMDSMNGGGAAPTPEPQSTKRRMTAGPPQPERVLNRAERRKQKGK